MDQIPPAPVSNDGFYLLTSTGKPYTYTDKIMQPIQPCLPRPPNTDGKSLTSTKPCHTHLTLSSVTGQARCISGSRTAKLYLNNSHLSENRETNKPKEVAFTDIYSLGFFGAKVGSPVSRLKLCCREDGRHVWHAKPQPMVPASCMQGSSPGCCTSDPAPCLRSTKADKDRSGAWTTAPAWETWNKLQSPGFASVQLQKL